MLLLLSAGAAHKVDVPALEFGGTEGDVPCCGSILTAIPLFFLKTVLPTSVTCTSPAYRHVFDLEVLETTDTETIYELPRSYDLLDNVTGILIYSDYAYAAVREDSNLRLHPLSPVRRRKLGRIFIPPRRAMPK